MKFTKLNYCQYLLSSQTNYTLTNRRKHLEVISHDKINRYLKNEKLTPSLLWDNVKELIEKEENAYLIFDDTVIDKRYSEEIELTRWQYSGNEHGVIRGIGLISCIYVNPKIGKFWVIDYRIYNPSEDGKTKIDHVLDMLESLVGYKEIPFSTVSLPTIYLKILRMLCNRCARFVGRLKSFTPELKQLTGVESCQCRKARIQRNHESFVPF